MECCCYEVYLILHCTRYGSGGGALRRSLRVTHDDEEGGRTEHFALQYCAASGGSGHENVLLEFCPKYVAHHSASSLMSHPCCECRVWKSISGTVPVSLLHPSERSWVCGNPAGMVPLSWLARRLRLARCVMVTNAFGIVPVSALPSRT